jgi:hypothetical protein
VLFVRLELFLLVLLLVWLMIYLSLTLNFCQPHDAERAQAGKLLAMIVESGKLPPKPLNDLILLGNVQFCKVLLCIQLFLGFFLFLR